jgi:hypothetical protein
MVKCVVRLVTASLDAAPDRQGDPALVPPSGRHARSKCARTPWAAMEQRAGVSRQLVAEMEYAAMLPRLRL